MNQPEPHVSVAALLDGELPDPARQRAEQHLERCGACRQEWEALCALRAEARSLPREVAPPRDLWSGIAARIDKLESAAPAAAAPLPREYRWQRGMMAAAAAVVLVVASSATTAWLLREQPGAPPAAIARSEPAPQAVPALVAFRPAETEYLRTTEDLRLILDARREALDPRTVAVVETNLTIIDGAIREARAALQSDPNSRELTEMLSSAYQQKVELLERAVQLPAQI